MKFYLNNVVGVVLFTLAFDSSPIKGEGVCGKILCFVVICTSFDDTTRIPAYAGMTV